MQIDIDVKVLETVFAYATAAARLASYVDDETVVDGVVIRDELGKSIGELRRLIAALLDDPGMAQTGEESTVADEPALDVAGSVDDLRQLVARADALANAAEGLFDETIGDKDAVAGRPVERVAHLVGATAEAVRAAMTAGDRLARKLATHRSGRQ